MEPTISSLCFALVMATLRRRQSFNSSPNYGRRREVSSDWTERRKGSASSAAAVLSEPHSSRPSYIRELLRDIICLKTQRRESFH
ncbi:hypothetical protein EYF80_033471 [Liparis tanakae]|uniref:Uncharacterized protein n=1 Tax=Liparis tanakae TaxID=230148 RepID=A0A4Z2GT37_9TELE|nr:hypothetical protein EYF80_033471 [Liparis tanakae]